MADNTEIKKWKRLDSSYVLSEPWFPVRKDKVELPSGKVINDYFVWEAPDIATIVPVTADSEFVLVQQYRYGTDKIMYQFPAGMIDKDEGPEAAAKRELEEESGYMATNVEFLGNSASYPTKLTGLHYLYLAKDVTPGGDRASDENEPTRVVLKTPEELWDMINTGEFQVADSLAAALLALKRLNY